MSDVFDNDFGKDSQNLVTSKRITSLISDCTGNEQLIVPFKPPMSSETRVKIITPDFFTADELFGHNKNYSHGEVIVMHLQRAGFNGDMRNLAKTFQSPMLAVYGMLRTGLVTIADLGTHQTHLYTLNSGIINKLCGNKKQGESHAGKNSIFDCTEITAEKSMSSSIGECTCTVTAYGCTNRQTIIYTKSLLDMRKRLLDQLVKGVMQIGYFDFERKSPRRITTTLNDKALSTVMSKTAYEQMLQGVVDERRMATIQIPDLSGKRPRMANVFIPSILATRSQSGSG